MRDRRLGPAVGLVFTLCLLAPPSTRAVPLHLPTQGVITDNAGAPVADGAFAVTFTLYEESSGGVAVWEEQWPPGGGDCVNDPVGCVQVAGGLFSVELGTHVPLDTAFFASGQAQWLGLSVEGEPELPRRPLGSAAYALHAGSAAGLSCTGCVGLDQLAPAVVDLVGGAAAAGVSPGLLTSEYEVTVSADGLPVALDDVAAITATITIEEAATIQTAKVGVHLEHGDLTEVTVTLTAPNSASFVLHDKGPGVDLQGTYGEDLVPASGDLATLAGEDPSGTWQLTVLDGALGASGTLHQWSLELTLLSTDTVFVAGNLDIEGSIATPALNTTFGGTGGAGPLEVTEGTTILEYGVHDFSGIHIAAGATLTVPGPSANGVLLLRSRGDCTLAGTIDLRGLGARGGFSAANGDGQAGLQSNDGLDHRGRKGFSYNQNDERVAGGGGGGGAAEAGVTGGYSGHKGYDQTSGKGGAQLAHVLARFTPFYVRMTGRRLFAVGSGGGWGGFVGKLSEEAQPGAGGNGGGALILECAGALTFTGTVDVRGGDGGNGKLDGVPVSSGCGTGGGGGGAGGSILLVCEQLDAAEGTVLVAGGSGAAGFTKNCAGTLVGHGGKGGLGTAIVMTNEGTL